MGRQSLSATSRLFENEVSHAGFEIPVNHGERSQIEGGMGDDQRDDATRDGKNRSKHESDDQRLLDARKSLKRVMRQTEPNGGDQHDGDFRGRALPEKFA